MPVLIISLIFVILMSSPYFVGVLRQLPGTTFAGVVHYPLDYFYYLSFMAQGKLRWFTSLAIHTSEVKTTALYHWLYVLSGHLFSLVGISNIIGYQVLVLGLTVLLLYVSYQLIKEIIPSRGGRILAYLLFLTSNAWPGFTSWYNYGEPFIRFSSIPHHLLAQSAFIVVILVLIRLPRIPNSHFVLPWLLLLAAGFLLASTQTPLILVAALMYGLYWIKDKCSLSSCVLFSLIVLLCGAGPYVLYLKMLFGHAPYSFVVAWEASQQVHLTLIQFLEVNGPVVLCGFVGAILYFHERSRAKNVILLATGISWGLFLSPIPRLISILNVRFLSVVPTLTMACFTAIVLEHISQKKAVRVGITAVFLLIMLPGFVQQEIQRTTFDPTNAYFFLPNTVLDAYARVGNLVKPNETCFVVWPFHESFAGITGRRAFTSGPFTTINYDAKEKMVTDFFSDQTPVVQKTQLLKSNRISCVVTYTFTSNLPSALTPVYTNSYMVIYRVK